MIDSINIIMKPVGNRCNLRCKYCFADSNKYSGAFISIQEIEDFILKLEEDSRFRHIKFTWHGGEPLLWGEDNYKEIFEFQQKHLSQKEYMNIFQTNGTLLTQEYIDIIKKNNAYIGVSIDGPTYELNQQRFETVEQFNKLLDCFSLLKENQMNFAVFCTLTRLNLGHIDEIFDFIKFLVPYSYTLIPVMSQESLITANEWSEILEKTHKFYQETGILHSYTYNLDSLRPHMCMMNGRCQSFITIDNNGTVNKTCRINHELAIGNIRDENILDKIASYSLKPLEIKENSIFSRVQNRKYIYFQGDGCYYRKLANSNNDFIGGIVDYLKLHQFDTVK